MQMMWAERKKRQIVLLWLVIVPACMLVLCFQLLNALRSGRNKTPATLHIAGLIPYERLRALAQGTRVEDVACMRFYGPNLGRDHRADAILITDPRLIREFLQALQSAEAQPLPMLDRPDVLQIDFKRAPIGYANPAVLHFNAATVGECFGIAFNQTLGRLGDIEASEFRQEITQERTRICAIKFAHHGRFIDVTDATETKRLLNAFEQANRHLFWNTSAFADCQLILYRKSAHPLYYVLHLGPISIKTPLRQQKIALPTPLQQYCFGVFGQGP
jgi:hypothetical protein